VRVTKPKPTQVVQAELRAAGFQPDRRAGSHTTWVHPGGVRVTVPDGHRLISAGVYRTILRAVSEARTKEEENE